MKKTLIKNGNVLDYNPNKTAENSQHMLESYYPNLNSRQRQKVWIDVYVMNRLGTIQDGKPVYPMFAPEMHIAKKEEIAIADGVPVVYWH